jgi:Tfp pilus assembly protein PilW
MNIRIDRAKSEQGISLVEMVVAMAMAIIVTGAAVSMMVSVLQRQPELTERGDQVGQVRVGIDRFVREIRQGVVGSVQANTASGFKFKTYVDTKCGTTTVAVATKCEVSYSCSSEKCTRTTGPTGSTSSTVLAEKVKNAAAVFEYVSGTAPCSKITGEPVTFVGLSLEMRSKDGGVTKLQDGAGLRSCS